MIGYGPYLPQDPTPYNNPPLPVIRQPDDPEKYEGPVLA